MMPATTTSISVLADYRVGRTSPSPPLTCLASAMPKSACMKSVGKLQIKEVAATFKMKLAKIGALKVSTATNPVGKPPDACCHEIWLE
jgi:hypothetical protein